MKKGEETKKAEETKKGEETVSKIEALYTLEVKDKNGKTVSKITKPCKSFVLQFLQMLETQIFPTSTPTTVTDITGTDYTTSAHAQNFKADALVTDDAVGMLVGTGTTPVDNLDYVMETKIAHGVGAGQLSYGATSKVTSAEVGANVDFQLIRTFTNSSGSTINVTEIGIYGWIANSYKFLMLHEIVTLTAVPNGQTLTVTITYRTTV